MPITPETLIDRLGEAGYESTTVRHPPLFTVADAVKLRGNIDGRHTKNLFLKDKKDNYFLVTLGEDRVVDLKQLHKQIGAASRLSFGKPEELMEYLGILPGSVSAFAVVNDTGGHVEAIFDQELMDHRLINAHPLTNEATTTIATEALIAFMTECGHAPRILPLSS